MQFPVRGLLFTVLLIDTVHGQGGGGGAGGGGAGQSRVLLK